MKHEYLIVLGVCLAGPLVLSFSRKINFYKYPVRLVLSVLLPFAVFLLWDYIAVLRGHWSFNESYVSGIYILNLPIEEILFFVVIPFCALFTWEVVKYYSRRDK